MAQPTPSTERGDAAVRPEEPEVAAEKVETEEVATEAEVPLNRAARRAKAKGNNPSHVGPQSGRTDQGRGPRSHTKRQIG
jgi:hypothetical protein